MRRIIVLSPMILLAACSANTGQHIPADFTTPEGAILKLEEAYKNKDLEAAVRCKDFELEAELMLGELNTELDGDQEIVSKTAEVLELAFRQEIETSGFPDFSNVKSTYPRKEAISDRVVRVTEVCIYPDGGTSEQDILVGKTNGEWKVLNPE